MVLVHALYGHEKWELCFVLDQFGVAACSPNECGRVSTVATLRTGWDNNNNNEPVSKYGA